MRTKGTIKNIIISLLQVLENSLYRYMYLSLRTEFFKILSNYQRPWWDVEMSK